MSKLEGQFFTKENTVVEDLERGVHQWFSRPDITGSEDLIVVQVEVGPGEGHPFHMHPDMDEVIYIVSGCAEQWLEQESKVLQAGESVFVSKKMVHATFNGGDEPLVFLAILGPGADLEGSMVDVSEQEPWKNLRSE